jgi:glycine cleavage system H protein
MNIPANLKYTQSHEWARLEADGTVTVGITDHAQEALGDIVFLELPQAGRSVSAGQECAVVESVKAASDIYAPVSGEIVESNQAAVDAPESINQDAHAAWLFKIKPSDSAKCAAELDALFDAAAYEKIAAEG